jgi:putative oxidoreductase
MDGHVAMTIGRVLIALLFLWSGYDKLRSFAGTSGMMRAHHVPLVGVALPAAIALELLCGLMLLANVLVALAAALLMLFVIISSLLIPVRDLADPARRHQTQIMLASNAGLVGGLLFVFGSYV